MDFLTITATDKNMAIATAVHQREAEIFSYQMNIDNYKSMLAALPEGDWPEELVQYKGAEADSLLGVDLDVVQVVSDYAYRDKIAQLLRSEIIEQGKSKRVLAALKAQIDPAELASLLSTPPTA